MAFVPVPETLMVELRQELSGQQVENTLYFKKSGGWTENDAGILGDELASKWTDVMAPVLSVQLQLTSIHLTDLSSQFSFATDFVPAASIPGEVGGDCTPNNCALCVSFRSAARGRSGRGRNYVAGLAESLVSLNQFDPTAAIEIVSFYQSLTAIALDVDAQWVVVSRWENGLPREEGLARVVRSVLLVDLVIDSQRRRLPGRGT